MNNKLRVNNVQDILQLMNQYSIDTQLSVMTSDTHYMVNYGIKDMKADDLGNLHILPILKDSDNDVFSIRELGIRFTALLTNREITEDSSVFLDGMTMKFVQMGDIEPTLYFI